MGVLFFFLSAWLVGADLADLAALLSESSDSVSIGSSSLAGSDPGELGGGRREAGSSSLEAWMMIPSSSSSADILASCVGVEGVGLGGGGLDSTKAVAPGGG